MIKDGRMEDILQEDLYMSMDKLTEAVNKELILGLGKTVRQLWNDDSKVNALNSALKLVNSSIEEIRNNWENAANKFGKFLNDFEATVSNKLKEKLSDFKAKLVATSVDISTIYENLESLIDDPDKLIEKQTRGLLFNREIIVTPILEEENLLLKILRMPEMILD